MRTGMVFRVEECLERSHEEFGLLSVREVTASREARQRDALHEGRRVDTVLNGNQRIAFTPEDRDGRQIMDLPRSVQRNVDAALPS